MALPTDLPTRDPKPEPGGPVYDSQRGGWYPPQK